MTINGDLNAYLTNYIGDPATRKEIIENFFDWMLSGDVISRLIKENIEVEDYLLAVTFLKETQL